MSKKIATAALALCVALSACEGCEEERVEGAAEGTEPTEPQEAALEADDGVDVEEKVLSIGALNAESGPAAAIGRPYAIGKRILAELINAGGSELLPEGWTIRLVERDHAYNPQRAVQAFNEIKDEVLFIGTSFGTPPTMPLRPHLERDNVVAFAASLSSQMAEHRNTPPLGPSYEVEAMRAMDWVVEQAGGTETVKPGIIYQQDDYGTDGLNGWRRAAEHHGLEIASEQAYAPGQQDFTAAVTALKEAGATHVLLSTLPSATGPILGKAAELQFQPIWIGNTPSWIDGFFSAEVIPPVVFTNFYWVNGLPFWGEEVPGMERFIQAYEQHGREDAPNPDFYILASYIQGLAQVEAFRRALESGDVTREGYRTALTSMEDWNAGGMIQPLDLTQFPYVTGTHTRILKPKLEERSWEVTADYAAPAALSPS